MTSHAVAERIQEAAQGLGIEISNTGRDQLLAYLDLLSRWNAVYNLTSLREPGQMVTHHLLDCLAAVPGLCKHWAGTGARGESSAAGRRLLDVGSGGGLPGIILAILDPGLDVTCVDTVGKKAAFIRQAAGELGIANLQAIHSRVEQMSGTFDVITSRAFATLADFARLTTARMSPGGAWMAMKGKRPDAEIEQLPTSVRVFHVEQLTVPGLDADRCIVWMQRSLL